ncbi:MAG: hypothetical protein FXF47_02615 [Candidatus Mcinerneyibacterium aminivorans]|uniref:P-II family nitrogen regulator n=1 Tax=Candidatus Mcinerneyibacterium aminivorans TaxID=2703815 RepID=A0A5D0MJJ3_9BACT|nr:MAG: hypothetical protein FXF47_02615 [Candidatus Mcinerneyibacterium aminivorans]
MKKVSIIYSATIFEEMKKALEDIGIKAYSIIPTVYGKGLSTQPRFDSHVWPGKNQMIIIICDEKSSNLILDEVNQLRKKFPKEGIIGYIENIDDITEHEKINPLQ